MKRKETNFCGCLIGGAIGDAFGAPVKFMKYDKIKTLYGEQGITQLTAPAGQKATITDDTQMTLFTAEGLMRSVVRSKQKHIALTQKDTMMVVFRSYLRWLYTQGLKTPNWPESAYDGYLIKNKGLYGFREPGVTCLTALGKGVMGTFVKPINQSRRCGTIIRVAPVGLFETGEHVFDAGAMTGAITHGHPSAYLSSGVLASIIHYIIEGLGLKEAIRTSLETLKRYEGHQECLETLERAVAMAEEGNPSVEKIQSFGDGFMADAALAMGIYAALSYPDNLEKALLLTINQDGNSNSSAVVAGSILGAYHGMDAIEPCWLEKLELADVIQEVAKDLLTVYEDTPEWVAKYPGW